MANYETKSGDVRLFLNDKKGVPARPDWKGFIMIEGKTYDLALWNKKSATGKPFLSGTATERKETTQKQEEDKIPY